MRIAKLTRTLVIAAAGMSALVCAAARGQSDVSRGLDALAQDVATAIRKNSHGAPSPVKVLVADFHENDGSTTRLGVELANELASALAKRADGFKVINRAQLEHVAWDNLADPNTWMCYGKRKGTVVILEGLSNEANDDELTVLVRGIEFHAPMFDRRVEVPLTPAMKTLAAEHLEEPSVPTWVSRSHPPDADMQPATPGRGGVGYPACIYCPAAQYSSAGTTGRVQGSVELDVVITADGHPAKITVLRGLPCGMSDAAMKAVEQWRFRPATASDGKPVEVLEIVEVTFYLY